MKTALILGATGGVGGEIANALAERGWQIRAMARRMPDATQGFDWIQGDALDGAAVLRAAQGVDAIVHAVNPPGYRDWDRLVLPMLDASIAAARATGARLALPGTIYNFDPQHTPIARPNSPQHPDTHKGTIRVEMERRIQASGVRALILRAGDFFGPRPGNNWLSQGLVKPGKPIRSIMNPATPGIGHGWAYLPDVGEAFARLLDRDAALDDFARHHFTGIWDAGGTTIVNAIAAAAGDPGIPVRRMPWALLSMAGLFSTPLRETAKMRGFWAHPVALDNASLTDAIGPEPHTPLDQAMRTTLTALGCLDTR